MNHFLDSAELYFCSLLTYVFEDDTIADNFVKCYIGTFLVKIKCLANTAFETVENFWYDLPRNISTSDQLFSEENYVINTFCDEII